MNRLVPLAAHSDVGSDCVLAQQRCLQAAHAGSAWLPLHLRVWHPKGFWLRTAVSSPLAHALPAGALRPGHRMRAYATRRLVPTYRSAITVVAFENYSGTKQMLDALTMGPFATTRMACQPEVMERAAVLRPTGRSPLYRRNKPTLGRQGQRPRRTNTARSRLRIASIQSFADLSEGQRG